MKKDISTAIAEALGIREKTDADNFREITEKMAELFEMKNADYGGTYRRMYDLFGPNYFTMMITQKMARIDSVVNHGTNNFESIEDSFRDAANYCILAMIAMKDR